MSDATDLAEVYLGGQSIPYEQADKLWRGDICPDRDYTLCGYAKGMCEPMARFMSRSDEVAKLWLVRQ